MSRLAVGEFSAPRPSAAVKRAPRRKSPAGKIAVTLLIVLLSAILAAGWMHRSDPAFTPRYGLGYLLGIAGSVMMLLVLLYPLRKRIKFMRSWAKLVAWFRLHMVFGCLGPVLVVVHSRFEAKSLNGFMALASTLIVASSGIIGRYLYVRVHRGLSEAKLEARELLNDAVSIRIGLEAATGTANSAWEARLKALETHAIDPARSLSRALVRALALRFKTYRAERLILREWVRRPRGQAFAVEGPKELRNRLTRYFRALRRAGSLAVYERLFALWHVLHLPLIVLLVFTAIVHVIAVHLY